MLRQQRSEPLPRLTEQRIEPLDVVHPALNLGRDPRVVAAALDPGDVHTPMPVTAEFGDYYARCGCGAISLPMALVVDAQTWVCPLLEAERELARNRAYWEARVRDAAMCGYRI